MSKTTQNLLLLLGVVLLGVIPLVLHHGAGNGTTEIFTGADGQAEALVGEIDPGYKPWFAPIWEPPSGEIESLLFGLQAAIGSGLLFYYIGYHRGRKSKSA